MRCNFRFNGGFNQGSDTTEAPSRNDIFMMNRRTLTNLLAIAVTGSALIMAGCSTVESRINEHPDVYQSLSARDQGLVSRGQIRTGMSQDAVWLAWGSADQRVAGAMRNQQTETWVYTTTASYPYGYGGFGGYGPGWGPYGPWGWGWGGSAVFRVHGGHRFVFVGSPFYDPFYYSYIPTYTYPYKTVTFANGHVVSFQYSVAPYR